MITLGMVYTLAVMISKSSGEFIKDELIESWIASRTPPQGYHCDKQDNWLGEFHCYRCH